MLNLYDQGSFIVFHQSKHYQGPLGAQQMMELGKELGKKHGLLQRRLILKGNETHVLSPLGEHLLLRDLIPDEGDAAILIGSEVAGFDPFQSGKVV